MRKPPFSFVTEEVGATLPLRDSVFQRTRAVTTWGLIALNVLAFMGCAHGGERVFWEYGLIPQRLFSLRGWQEMGLIGSIKPLVGFMFLHAGLLHLAGNMLFLWIFGRGIESKLGAGRFVALYLLAGLASGLGHAVFAMFLADKNLPLVGASGAVAGVLGAYLLLYPRAWVLTFVPPLFSVGMWVLLLSWLTKFRPPRWALGIVWLPAVFFLVMWFVLQVLNGYHVLAGNPMADAQVSWWAHIFGFITGCALIHYWSEKRGG